MDRRKQGKKFKQKNVGKPVDVEALKQDMLNALYVAGKKCVISRNDSMAASIDSGSHLIPWNEKDKNRMIDRFDGRIFFDMESQFVYKKPLKESISTSEEEKMCDEERYFDLFNRVEEDKETKEILKRKAEMDPTEDDDMIARKSKIRQNALTSADPHYVAVGFKYKEEPKILNTTEDPPFTPPFPVPDGTLLPSQMLHEVMLKSAKYILSQGASATKQELLLKLRQSGNPNFTFLLETSPYYPYWKFLKKNMKSIEMWNQLGQSSKEEDYSLIESALAGSSELKRSLGDDIPVNQKTIIEKTAEYSVKYDKFRGDIEIKEKDNPNFQFLKSGNEYHKYYLQCIEKEEKKINPTKESQVELPVRSTSNAFQIEDEKEKKKLLRLQKAKLFVQMVQKDDT